MLRRHKSQQRIGHLSIKGGITVKTKTITQRILTAEEGMHLTDGETYGKTVVLPADADYSAWHEITDAEYAEIVAEQEAKAQEMR